MAVWGVQPTVAALRRADSPLLPYVAELNLDDI
jgi:hypothetical protein